MTEIECEIVEQCWLDPACRCVDAPEVGRCQGCEDAPVGMAVMHDQGCLYRDDDEPKCAQEMAGFGPPCSDPMCEACRG